MSMLNRGGIDILTLKAKLMKRGFQILILLGIFVVLLQPKVDVRVDKEEAQEQKISWFDDISLRNETESETPASVQELTNIEIVGLPKDTNEYIKNKKLVQTLNGNKKLIAWECLRIEPKLSKYSGLGSIEQPKIPSLDYIFTVLEQKIGAEKLYSDVDRGVEYVFEFIKDYERGK